VWTPKGISLKVTVPTSNKEAFTCINDPVLLLLIRNSYMNVRQQVCSLNLRAVLVWMATAELLLIRSVGFLLLKDLPFPTSTVSSTKFHTLRV